MSVVIQAPLLMKLPSLVFAGWDGGGGSKLAMEELLTVVSL